LVYYFHLHLNSLIPNYDFGRFPAFLHSGLYFKLFNLCRQFSKDTIPFLKKNNGEWHHSLVNIRNLAKGIKIVPDREPWIDENMVSSSMEDSRVYVISF